MAIVINGSGTVTGISVGGLPDGIVDAGTLATNSVDSAELIDGSIDTAHIATDQITSAILPAGSILQVVSATYASSTSTTSSSLVDTGLTATITPTSSDSTILIFATLSLFVTSTGGDTRIGANLLRDAASVFEAAYIIRSNTGGHDKRIYAVNLEDSPATTSATVYKMQFKRSAGSDTIYVGINSEPSSMILMEVAG